ncbi:MAG: hypothetical protein EPO21_21060 [Chloroflexota bacterium]|nr:MAG: hypothetical protein EPO21_21060 [Chloroflexota bacterium]
MKSHLVTATLAGLLILALVLTGCGGSQGTQPQASGQASKPSQSTQPSQSSQSQQPAASTSAEPYKIGVLLSKTGGLALMGTRELEGIQFLANKINAAGGINGHKLELIYHDIESKPDIAVSFAKQLIEKDKVVALIGLESLAVATPVIPVVEEARVPMVAAMGLAPVGKKYAFASYPSGDLSVYADLWYLLTKKNATTFGVLASNDGIGQWSKDTALPQQNKALGDKLKMVGFESFEPTDKDVSTQLAKLKSGNPGGILLATSGAAIATAAKNIKQMNLGLPVVAYGNSITPEFIDLVGDAGDAVFYASPKAIIWDQLPASDPQKDATGKAAAEFEKTTGKTWTLSTAVGYDTLLPVAEALKAVGPDREKIKAAIETGQKGLQGAAGIWSRTPEDHVGTPVESYVMVTIKDKKVQLLDFVK